MRNATGTSLGWDAQGSASIKHVEGESVAKVAPLNRLGGMDRKRLDPGKHTMLLDPTAPGDIMQCLAFAFCARDAVEGQSFLSKPVGCTRSGEKMFPEYITLRSDPFHPELAVTPWADSLLPNEKIEGIEEGFVKNLLYDWFRTPEEDGKKPTPVPHNLVLECQFKSFADLIKSSDRGLPITRLWYIRVVQPQTWQRSPIR